MIHTIGTFGAGAVARARALVSWRRLTGASSVLLGTVVAQNLLRIVNTVILTRLLAPADYGLVGIIMSVFFVISLLTDTGLQSFIIQHANGLRREFLDALWTIHLIRGVFLMLVAAALALPVSWALDKPQLAPLLAVCAVSLAIDGSVSLSIITALRRKMTRKLSVLDLSAFVFQMAIGLTMAFVLRNAWAIVMAIIASSAARTLASFTLFPDARRRLRWDRAVALELWSFSRLIAASSMLTLVISQVDRLVLARLFSLQQFGVYSVAGALAAAPIALVHLYTSRIMYPVIAETWRTAPDLMRERYHAIRGIVFYGYLLAAGGLIGSAKLIVTILYDPRYAGAGFYLRLLSITPALFMLTKSMNDLFVASGRVRMTLHMNIIRITWLLAGALTGYLLIGPNGVVMALAMIEVPTYCFAAYRLRSFGLYNLRHELRAFAVIGVGVALGLLAAIAVPMILPIS